MLATRLNGIFNYGLLSLSLIVGLEEKMGRMGIIVSKAKGNYSYFYFSKEVFSGEISAKNEK